MGGKFCWNSTIASFDIWISVHKYGSTMLKKKNPTFKKGQSHYKAGEIRPWDISLGHTHN
jgi:hypothetical protein